MGSRFALGSVEKGARQVWWLAHRDELVEQAAARLRAEGAARVGVIAAGYPATNAPLQVASIQTLAARASKGLPTDLDLVVFDECHHLPAPGWIEVVRSLRPKLLIGLTATPERGDGIGLGVDEGGLFDDLVQVTTVRELQDEGHLVPCITYAPANTTKNLSQDPVAAYLARAPGERAFVFCADVAHAEKIAISFIGQGVPAATIHAKTPPLLRKARLEAFRLQDQQPLREAGSLDRPPLVLCNVYTLTEGVDVPEASCVILARGAGHPGIMLQMAGRGLRPAPWAGKTRCVFLDLRGVVHKLGLPEADREWSLSGKAAKLAEKERETKLKPCPACGGMVGIWSSDRDGWRVCPLCRERIAPPEPPKVEVRELHQMGRLASPEAKAGALKGLARAAARRSGNRAGWVAHRYRDKFGEWPPFGAARQVLLDMGIDPKGPPREPEPNEAPDAPPGDEAFTDWLDKAVG